VSVVNQQRYVFDVTEADFQQRVLVRSREVPVVVDFWAEWCGPCKTLTPVLEKLAAEFKGAFEVAKVDVDKNERLAAMLRIQSIPTVYAFVDGQPVDGFQGAQPEKVVRQFIERLVPPPEEDPLEIAEQALAAGDTALAEKAFRRVLETKPDSGVALLGLARVALSKRDTKMAATLLDRIKEADPAWQQAQRVKGVLAFGEHAADEKELRQRIAANARDPEAWYQLGATLALNGRHDEAMDAFLEVVKVGRSWNEDAGRKALLSLFDLLGADDPRTMAARRRLASLLF
jgi:putative thioredoxin